MGIEKMFAYVELMRTGMQVRNVREWLGLSCQEFAEETGNLVEDVIRVESGRMLASDAFLAKICRKYHGLSMTNFTDYAPIDWESVY